MDADNYRCQHCVTHPKIRNRGWSEPHPPYECPVCKTRYHTSLREYDPDYVPPKPKKKQSPERPDKYWSKYNNGIVPPMPWKKKRVMP